MDEVSEGIRVERLDKRGMKLMKGRNSYEELLNLYSSKNLVGLSN
jgi:ABC-type Zn2+ transport system substrate-binding protein/surface adhesin